MVLESRPHRRHRRHRENPGEPREEAIIAIAGPGVSLGIAALLWLVLIAIFIWIGATAEAGMVGVKSVLTKIPADKAMLTDFETLENDESLARAIDLDNVSELLRINKALEEHEEGVWKI
ncbi:MAG: hypothetical protein RQ826_12535 [Xanthomonadales bacterium]|nr:hypothetical protein [Xanthomonadales bacterium]